ncbi:hypothetical protein SLEP1_g40971 [Rubroshorea leprosula]|uniref:Uncharacterized protein n=1 Tax=Rubroshorea leprosula TaxID=152421 RepID=A0AAV5L5I0_9ROSI|nr:hypothetical protein SLEP1_g40971 [Rubroshorea leprosula]
MAVACRRQGHGIGHRVQEAQGRCNSRGRRRQGLVQCSSRGCRSMIAESRGMIGRRRHGILGVEGTGCRGESAEQGRAHEPRAQSAGGKARLRKQRGHGAGLARGKQGAQRCGERGAGRLVRV